MSEERVEHPKHYNSHPSGVECIDIADRLDFSVGNCYKYVFRAGIKSSDTKLEDLRKALFYANRADERSKKQSSALYRTEKSIELMSLSLRVADAEKTDTILKHASLAIFYAAQVKSPDERLTLAYLNIAWDRMKVLLKKAIDEETEKASSSAG